MTAADVITDPDRADSPAFLAALTFATVAATNRTRCERWHPGFPNDGWVGSDWSNAMQGEAGEAGNKVKKLRRIETGMKQAAGGTREQLLDQLATEIGDTFMYLDLLCQYYGLSLAECVVNTFNRVSIREGFPDRIGYLPPCENCGRDIQPGERRVPIDHHRDCWACMDCYHTGGGDEAVERGTHRYVVADER